MVRSLTKMNKAGALYTRPPDVEEQVDRALALPINIVSKRALIQEPDDPNYMKSECLVHLIREARRRGDHGAMNTLIAALFCRCNNILAAKVPDGSITAAAELRDDILQELGKLFALDGTDGDKGYLDFFECRFNRAFKALRTTVLRKAKSEATTMVSLPEDRNTDPQSDEERFARSSKHFSLRSNELSNARVSEALAAMAVDDRAAFILVHVMGYKIESIDPAEETAATRAKVSGRTIRSRLARAIECFKKHTEEPHERK